MRFKFTLNALPVMGMNHHKTSHKKLEDKHSEGCPAGLSFTCPMIPLVRWQRIVPDLMKLGFQGVQPGVESITNGPNIEDSIQVIDVGRFDFFPQACREGVNHGHEEEAIKFELHRLHHVISYTYRSEGV